MAKKMNQRKRTRRVIAGLGIAALCLAGSSTTRAQEAPAAKIAAPPMGWSSWNSFSNTIDAKIAMAQARAMVSNGMQKAGYQYINIDEGWWRGQRDAEGNFVVDPKAWPALKADERAGDMSNIVRYIHGLGLKAGIYTDAGQEGCSMYPSVGPVYHNVGSEGHYDQDFLQFARWGFDYVKVDWCGGDKENLDPAVEYAEVARAIARAEKITGRKLYFSICEWGKNSPWTWAPGIGGVPANIWRTSGDIVDPIVAGTPKAHQKAEFSKMLSNFDQGIHPEAEHTGFYNDPDMMVLGMPGLDEQQNRVHMSLWAISGAPLLIGANLTKLTPAELAMVTNRTVVAIDQDGAGLQAVKIAETTPGVQVWAKPLEQSGTHAVLLLNRTKTPQNISVRWSDLGLTNAPVKVTNVWQDESQQNTSDAYTANVAGGDAVLLLVAGKDAPMTRYTNHGNQAIERSHEVTFTQVRSRFPMARIAIEYRNPDGQPRRAELRTNGNTATRVLFPPTGNKTATVWIEAPLKTNADNVLNFSSDCNAGPSIASIEVQ